MVLVLGGSLALATLTYMFVESEHRSWRRSNPYTVRWVFSPYRSSHPAKHSTPSAASPIVVKIAAWASFAHCFVMAPCLVFALAQLHLGAFTPLVAGWLAIAVSNAWCGKALIRWRARAAAQLRILAQLSLVFGLSLFLVDAFHLVCDASNHDPGLPSLSVRLALVSSTIVQALLLAAAVRSSPLERNALRLESARTVHVLRP
jgi:hypothetical protein